MILSVALRSLCPLVISPGFLIHSFMSSAHSVRGGLWLDCQISVFLHNCSSHLHLSLMLPPLVLKLRLSKWLRAVHLISPFSSQTYVSRDREVIDCVDACIFACEGLCSLVYVLDIQYVCCEDPMAYLTRANLSNERSEKGIGSALVGGRARESERERDRARERERERERERRSTGSKL